MNIDIKLEIVTIICEQKKKKKIFCHKIIIQPQLENIKKAIHETRSIKKNQSSRLLCVCV